MSKDTTKNGDVHDNATAHEAARDELLDLGLQELSGKSEPPDLTQRIIAVATQTAARENAAHATVSTSSQFAARSRGYAREVLCACALLATAIGGYFLGGGAGQLQLLAMGNSSKEGIPTQDFGRPATVEGEPSPQQKWQGMAGKTGLAEEAVGVPKQHELIGRIASSAASGSGSSTDADEGGGQFGFGGGLGGGQIANTAPKPRNSAGDSDGDYGYYETTTMSLRGGRGAIGNVIPGNAKGVYDSREAGMGEGELRGGRGVTIQLGDSSESMVRVLPVDGVNPDWVVDILEQQMAGNRLASEKADVEAYVRRVKQLIAQEEEGHSGDRYRAVHENRFLDVRLSPLSTFSIDVDTASYSKARRMILQQGVLPPPEAVRIEEFVNYFAYDYPHPVGKEAAPFAVNSELAACPWQPGHYLMRVALAGKHIDQHARPTSNLVFLLDVSGSMDSDDKLGLVKDGLKQLVERLGENDRVAIVVYAGDSGLVLPSTNGTEKAKILSVIDELKSQGSTNGAAGIELAYQLAEENLIADGVNRVILCTDGDFNVGVTSDGGLVSLVEEKAKSGVFLTALGFGIGNHNDSMLEQIADRGNGSYAYIDSRNESFKVFAQQMSGTLVTIAKDVKIQVEFNPAHVAGYRLVGYENRMLATEDFADDTKDAGEIGAGHTVTALYEIIPAGVQIEPTPGLKYQRTTELTAAAQGGEFANVALRYKEPNADVSQLLEVAISDPRAAANDEPGDSSDGETSEDTGEAENVANGPGPMPQGTDEFQFAAAVASFAMILRNSAYQGETSFDAVLEMARGAGPDEFGYRAEFLQIVEEAKRIALANQPAEVEGQ